MDGLTRTFELEDCACTGGNTRETLSCGETMEECIVCGREVRWDLTEHPFFGYSKPCDIAKKAGWTQEWQDEQDGL